MHLGSITATLWVLLLNGLVGFQILDDGTPISLGLILGSAVAFFVGTGYVALDTAFSYSSTFVRSMTAPNRNIALYVLYQLWPLVCLFFFFVLESVLVLRVLGERKPMSTYTSQPIRKCHLLIEPFSLPPRRRPFVCYRPDFSICDQQAYLYRDQWQNRRRPFRDALHALVRCDDLGLLVQHYRRRLADRWRGDRIQMTIVACRHLLIIY